MATGGKDGFRWPTDGSKEGEDKKDKDAAGPSAGAGQQTEKVVTRAEIGNQARVLIARFVHDRMEADGLPVPLEEELLEPGTPQGEEVMANRQCREIANYLKIIGDELDNDESIQRMFNSLDPTVPHETFMRVAKSLFASGDYTWGRVTALFYFSYRMAKKSVGHMHIMRTIIEWVVRFIVDFLSEWIIGRGGWLAIREHFGTPGTTLAGILIVALAMVGIAYVKGDH